MWTYTPLVVGDRVRVEWNNSHVPIRGILKKLPAANAPYWEVWSDETSGGWGPGCVCAFTGTVKVSRLLE